MKIENIKNPKFLKKLNIAELQTLSQEIREFILNSVSKTGGHLSSNLGVVELSVALHYCFNAPEDKILFDVGHQCYTHKILTGRANKMSQLRQYGGISGFQKRRESIYDCFEAGHSSTALPAALGMAAARDLNHEKYEIIPVVGDGSLVSGLSLEALSQIGYQKRKMIIVFNDNNMSISKNVGALPESINKLRNSVGYNNLKSNIKSYLKNKKYGEFMIKEIHDTKERIKAKLIDENIFDNFGIYYIGPVDGHNINDLVRAFEVAKSKDGPVVVHCLTKKGKGYAYAENDLLGKWHGISKFDLKTGKTFTKTPEDEISYSKLVANCLDQQMAKDQDIVAITPAMISGSCLKEIFEKYPLRAFDVGIAEDLAVDFASGLALAKKKPFVCIYSSFLQRAYDQLNHDVSRMNLNVTFGIDRAGLVGEDGETHHGVYDISLLRSLPKMVLTQGMDGQEINDLINTGLNYDGPFAIRFPRGNLKKDINFNKTKQLKIGSWTYLIKQKKPKVFILSYGSDLLQIKKIIEDNNLNYSLINTRFLKPLDEKILKEIAKIKKPIYIYTVDMLKGGIGDDILEYYNQNKINVNLNIMGINDEFVTHGNLSKLKEELHLTIKDLFKKIENQR